MTPRQLTALWTIGLMSLVGCNSPLFRSQSPEPTDLEALAESEPDGTKLVGDTTFPIGLTYLKIEGVALVNGLARTGSEPPPGPLTSALVGDMQTHEVANPQQVLKSDTNSLVVVRAFLPPGVQKGDRIDVKVVVPPKSETTSLRGGYLLRCRMREMQVVQDGSLRSGHVSALAQGPVVIDGVFEVTDDPTAETTGRVLGGAQSQVARSLGLGIRGETTVRQAALIGSAINNRFHKSDATGNSGVAKPKRDNFIELAVHPRYKNNVFRYMRVIRAIAVHETPGERAMRTEALRNKLLEPTTAARAALQLEAIGEEAAHVLFDGLKSSDLEVRFYAAEALAYLDREEASPVLVEAAHSEPAFRWHALAALAAMDHVVAYEGLNELLHVASAETRYGAFRALRTRNAADPLVRGEYLRGEFAYHVINSDGPLLIHASKAQRPEIVLFGQNHPLIPPAFLCAGKEIIIKGQEDGQLRVTRFGLGTREDQQEICDANVDAMIRSIVNLGGTYGDTLQALQEARRGGYMETKLVVNALANPSRKYHREEALGDDADSESAPSQIRAANPIPELFSDRLEKTEKKDRYTPDEIPEEPEENDESDESFMGKMTHWFQR